MTQDTIFLKSEGDAWFNRNRTEIIKSLDKDEIPDLLSNLEITPTQILDVGCASGDRLEVLRRKFNCEGYGVDPSRDAIESGMNRYPKLSLTRSTITEMRYPNEFFDLVTVRFVLHWVDRSTLLESCARIDACLKWDGYLIISDFYTIGFATRNYHHTNDGMFTYKQHYPDIFLATGNYEMIAKILMPYDATDNKFITVLRKTNVSIPEK